MGMIMFEFVVLLSFCCVWGRTIPVGRDTAPSAGRDFHQFNGDGDLEEQRFGDLVADVCGWGEGGDNGREERAAEILKGLLGRGGEVSGVVCGGVDDDGGGERVRSSNVIHETVKQVIFVEVPSDIREPRSIRHHSAPQTVVYVLPPEENHVYRIFDMRGGAGGKIVPSVHFLTSV